MEHTKEDIELRLKVIELALQQDKYHFSQNPIRFICLVHMIHRYVKDGITPLYTGLDTEKTVDAIINEALKLEVDRVINERDQSSYRTDQSNPPDKCFRPKFFNIFRSK